jgi:predicted transposase YdaD
MGRDIDVTVKQLLRRSHGWLLRQIIGESEVEWLNIELPRVSNPRVDLLARLPDGHVVHVELQTTNEADFPRRQAEYYLALWRQLGQPVEQVALYVGHDRLRMPALLQTEALRFRFHLIDIRALDGEPLLASADLADNLLAVLADVDRHRVMQRVIQRLSQLRGEEQVEAVAQFVILSGLRDGAATAFEEARRAMPTAMEDLVKHDSFFRGLWERAKAEGVQEGRQEGRQEAQEHGRTLLRQLLQKRFGPLPEQAEQRLSAATREELDRWTLQILDVDRLDALIPGQEPR